MLYILKPMSVFNPNNFWTTTVYSLEDFLNCLMVRFLQFAREISSYVRFPAGTDPCSPWLGPPKEKLTDTQLWEMKEKRSNWFLGPFFFGGVLFDTFLTLEFESWSPTVSYWSTSPLPLNWELRTLGGLLVETSRDYEAINDRYP